MKQLFHPGIEIGQVLKNSELVDTFKCGIQGGMRRSSVTNTLVIVSDYTKGIYHDKWIGGVLHYTGMGKTGDQDIHWFQNATLAESESNGIDVHLFEVIDAGEYIYCGRVELVGNPYTEIQPGEDGIDRKVWMFPIRPVPDNDVKKPPMFVFSNMEDYITRGKNVDAEYAKILANKNQKRKKVPAPVSPTVNNSIYKPPVVEPSVIIPQDIVGKKVKHKSFGIGTITKIDKASIAVTFEHIGEKNMDYKLCMENHFIEFI